MQARLLYHEAAGAISPETVVVDSSQQRIQLLTEAYELSAEATSLAPASLSCAALRATLAINLLVEESALLSPSNTPTATTAGASGSSSSGGSGSEVAAIGSCSHTALLERKCHELLTRFLHSIEACKAALSHPKPLSPEPVITLITPTHTTSDPCSMVRNRTACIGNPSVHTITCTHAMHGSDQGLHTVQYVQC